MRKNKILTLMLAICFVLPAMFVLTACGHKHSYSDTWSSDTTAHWHACAGKKCDKTKDSAEHTFVAKKDGTNHWSECSVCGYKTGETAHTYSTNHDDTKHWQECSCGYKKGEEEHDLTVAEINSTNHKLHCEDCDYVSGELDHTYEEDDQTQCDTCAHEREQATLAFKTGTYTFTYDGATHAFDKENLVTVEHANLSEVVVKYSTSKDNPVWTDDVPKNAGTYYVQLSVPATKDHTACTINNLEETSKVLRINRKSISLEDLILVCTGSEMNTSSSRMSLTLTSKDVNGLCGSDTLTATLYKKAVTETTFYGEGTEWCIKVVGGSDSSDESTDVGIQADTKGNYIFDGSTTGKLYVTKSLTESGEGTVLNPYTYTAEATIKKDGLAYYALDMNRSGQFHPESFDVALSDSNAKIEKVYTNVSWLSVTLAADGTLVTYGPAGRTTVYVVVKYEGADDSKAVTLTLTRKMLTSTVTSSEFTNALNLDNVSQYHTTVKEDGTVIEENKIDKTNNKFYKNDNGTEVYYEQYNSGVSFFKYAKNKDDKLFGNLRFLLLNLL